METKDCNGTPLQDGDSVKTTKDLKVKGAGMTIKRGTVVKGIRLPRIAMKLTVGFKK